jgi:Skp family chaperone for outer membrane proteins
MKKYLTIGLAAFVLGVSAANFAISGPTAFNVAVVDIQKVVGSSTQVAALKREHEAKIADLNAFVEKARKDVSAQTDDKKKKELETKYNKELNEKKAAMDKHYADKLQTIDKAITKQIETQAKRDNYDIVLAKGAVLHGGTDITEAVVKLVK